MRNGKADKSGHATLLSLFTIMHPNYETINKDEFEEREADRSGHATPLPPDSYSHQAMFYNEDEFDYGGADKSGRATPLPPDSYSHQ